MQTPWTFESNTFLSVTRKNFKLTDILIYDHVARLLKFLAKTPGDADLVVMYGRAASALSTWRNVYLPYRAAKSVYKARTQSVYEMLEGLPEKLDDWDIDIQAAGGAGRPFKAGKPAYTELFPLGRGPFTTGALDMRIAALETLVINLSAHAALAAVQTAVGAFTTGLRVARDAQQGEEAGTEADSEGVEAARVFVCDMMFRNTGRAMEKHGAVAMVGKYFDLSYVRDGAPAPPEGTLVPPDDLTVGAVAGTPGAVEVNFTPVPGATGHNLYRQLPGESGWTLVASGVSELPLTLTGQPEGVLIAYAVTSVNEAGEGTRSVPEEITL